MSDYLNTLRRIPDDIMLAIFAHDFDETSFQRCICGWAIRESLARAANTDAHDQSSTGGTSALPYIECANRFGGTVDDWRAIYIDVSQSALVADVEEAVVDRLNEIVS